MKKIIYLTLFAVLGISGCVSYDGYDTSFEKQYKMLECFGVLKSYMLQESFSSFIYKIIPYCYYK